MRSACSYSLLYRSIVFRCFLVFAPPPTPSPPAGRGLFTQGAPPPAPPLCINFSPPSPRQREGAFYAGDFATCTPAFALNFPHSLPACGGFYARGFAPCTPAFTLNLPHSLPACGGFYARGFAPCTPAFALNFPHSLPACGGFYAGAPPPALPLCIKDAKAKTSVCDVITMLIL